MSNHPKLTNTVRRLICFLLIINQVIYGQSYRPNTVQIDALENQTIRLPCKFNILSNELNQQESPVYFWMRKNHNSTENVSLKGDVLEENYKLDVNVDEGKYDLIINSASYYRDNGQFECRVKKSGTGQDLKSTFYQVTILIPPGPPVIRPELPIAREDEPFELTCYSVGGSPSPEIEWFRNNVPIPSELTPGLFKDQATKSVLKIIPSMTDDRLTYSCRVYNRAISRENATESQVSLRVYYTPRVTVGPHNPLNVFKGSDTELTCNVVANPPPKRITWLRNNRVIANTNNARILNIEPTDSGSYSCQADNGILDKQGQMGSSELQLNVLYGPIVSLPESIEPKINEPVDITCEVNSNPKPHTISWYKTVNGMRRLVQEGAQMTILKVRPEDSGLYTCLAQNTLKSSESQLAQTHSANSTIEIKVKHAPEMVVILPEKPIAISGRPFTLTCKSQPESHPKPTYKWWKEGENEKILSSESELHFKVIHVRQEGKYFCSAENELGSSEPTSIDLVINEPPSITFQMPPTIIKKQSDSGYSLVCKARGKPIPNVTWYHNQQMISNEPTTYNQYGEQSISSMYRIETITNQDNSNGVESILHFESPARKNNELAAFDHARFSCMFDNGLTEQPVKGETFVKVEHSPILKHEHNRVAFDVGETATLECRMSAFPKCNFEWYIENRLITSGYGSQPKYNITFTDLGDDIYMSTLHIANIKKMDYGDYQCRAGNNLGDDEKTIIKLTEKSAPEAPTHPQIIEIQSDYVVLGWQAGFNGGYQNTEYILSYSNEDSMFSKWRNETCRTMNPCKLTNLHSRKTYQFKVMANNQKGHSAFSDYVEGQTKVSFKDIPIPFEAYYDNVYNMITFKIDQNELDLLAKIEVKTSANTGVEMVLNNEEMITKQEQWKLLVTSDMKNDNEHVIYLPIIQASNSQALLNDKNGLQTITTGSQYNDMRVSICLKMNTTLCSLAQSVKMDYVSNYYRENRVYTTEQLVLFILVGISLALGLVVSVYFYVNKQRKNQNSIKKDYESDSDSENRAKVSTISNNYFNSNDNKALVDSQDNSKMMPPPVYTTSPNTPTSTIGCNNGLSQNTLQLNGNNNYNTYGSDPSPNNSNDTTQSDLWMMKNELLMPGDVHQAQLAANQSHYGTQEMNGLINPYQQQHYNTYGSPIDYSYYSHYSRNQAEEFQPLAENNYNINVKNSLYAPYYEEENGYGTTMQIPNQPQLQQQMQMDTNDYFAHQQQAYQPQQQPQFEGEASYNSQANGTGARVIREIIV